jgi:hypothetical protein
VVLGADVAANFQKGQRNTFENQEGTSANGYSHRGELAANMNDFYEQRKQAPIDQITVAFDGVELGEGVSFHESFIVDDYRIEDRNHELRREARAKDTETRWQNVPERDIAAGALV